MKVTKLAWYVFGIESMCDLLQIRRQWFSQNPSKTTCAVFICSMLQKRVFRRCTFYIHAHSSGLD